MRTAAPSACNIYVSFFFPLLFIISSSCLCFYPAKLGFLEFGIKVFGFLYDNIFTTYHCKCLSEMKLNLKHDICNALEPGFELSPFTTRSLEKEHFWFTFLFPSKWDQNQIFWNCKFSTEIGFPGEIEPVARPRTQILALSQQRSKSIYSTM